MNWRMETGAHPKARLPLRAGVGLKPQHIADILALPGDAGVGFFEVHAENYLGDGGAPHAQLGAIRDRWAISIHGVGLSIGGVCPLNRGHLDMLKRLCDRYQPEAFSEHLAWSSHGRAFYNDLLPLPYNRSTLEYVCDHVDEVQEHLGRRMLLENPSTYIAFTESTMPETEFLAAVARRTGCGLLLDLNNVYVSATNQGYSATDYLAQFPIARVEQMHLAAYASDQGDDGSQILIDAHCGPIYDVVWELYAKTIRRTGRVPTLIEWDNDIRDFAALAAEAAKAETVMARSMGRYEAAE